MIDLKKRTDIRRDEMQALEPMMTKLRADIQKGYCPQTPKEFADWLSLAVKYGKKVGTHEECKDILEKTGGKLEAQPMMEKTGVECQGKHLPDEGNMVKIGSDLKCRHCGQKFAAVEVQDKAGMKDQMKGAGQQAKNAVDNLFGG